MSRLFALAVLVCLTLAASGALADDWTAIRLRGQVQELVDGSWAPVHRNDIVADETVIRTLADGYVDLVRGAETVSLQPDTQLRILDKGGSKPFTTVQQSFGTVSIEAEVQNVQHFAVDTPYLAAVVKGTRFTVAATDRGATVSVQRGHVEVSDKHDGTKVTIGIGQRAAVGDGKTASSAIVVSGTGQLPQVTGSSGEAAGTAGDVLGDVVHGAGDVIHELGNGLGNLIGGHGNGQGDGQDNGIGNDGHNNGHGNEGHGNGHDGLALGLHPNGLRLPFGSDPDWQPGDAGVLWI